ncbi:TPA: hypothetical protein ACKFJT_006660, partial [Burkholderia cenocepacia]
CFALRGVSFVRAVKGPKGQHGRTLQCAVWDRRVIWPPRSRRLPHLFAAPDCRACLPIPHR